MKVLTNFRIKLLLFDTQSIVHLNMRGLKMDFAGPFSDFFASIIPLSDYFVAEQ